MNFESHVIDCIDNFLVIFFFFFVVLAEELNEWGETILFCLQHDSFQFLFEVVLFEEEMLLDWARLLYLAIA